MATATELSILISSDTSGAEGGMRRLGSIVGQTGKGFQAMGLVSTAALGAVTGGVLALAGAGAVLSKLRDTMSEFTDLLGYTISAASDLSEAQNKVTVVFGESAQAVFDFAANAPQALGQTREQAIGAAGTFGNLLTAMGMVEPVAAQMSINLVSLASDLASFNNIDPTEALEKLRAGLTGETEPLKSLGINLTQARIEAEAFALGIAQSGEKLSAAQKAAAAYSLIVKDTSAAQNDFSRTSEGLANSQRIVSASIHDAAAAFGGILLPVAEQAIGTLGAILPNALQILVQAFGTMGDAIAQDFARFRAFLVANDAQLRAWLKSGAAVLAALAKVFWAVFVAIAKIAWAGMQALIKSVAGGLSKVTQDTGIANKSVLQIFSDTFVAIVEGVGIAMTKVAEGIRTKMKEILGILNALAKMPFMPDFIVQGIADMAKAAADALDDAGTSIIHAAAEAREAFRVVGQELSEGLGLGLTEGMDALPEIDFNIADFGALPEGIAKAEGAAKKAGKKAGKRVGKAASQAMQEAMRKLMLERARVDLAKAFVETVAKTTAVMFELADAALPNREQLLLKLTKVRQFWIDAGNMIQEAALTLVERFANTEEGFSRGLQLLQTVMGTVKAAVGAIAAITTNTEQITDITATQLGIISRNVGRLVTLMDTVSLSFQAMEEEARTKLVRAMQDYARAISAAGSAAKAIADVNLAEAVDVSAVQLGVIARTAGRLVTLLQGISRSFQVLEAEARGELVRALSDYSSAVKVAAGMVKSVTQLGLDELVEISAAQLGIVRRNVEAMFAQIKAMSTEFQDMAADARTNLVAAVSDYAKAAKESLDLMAKALGVSKEWSDVAAITNDVMGIALASIHRITERILLEKELFEDIYGMDRLKGVKEFTDGAKQMVSLMTAAAGLTQDWSKITAVTGKALSNAALNIRLIVDKMRGEKELFERRHGLGALEGVKEFTDAVAGIVREFTDAAAALSGLTGGGNLGPQIEQAKQNVKLIIEAFFGEDGIMSVIGVHAAQAAADVATAAGGAAAGMSKLADFITKFIENPLFVSKKGSNFFQKVRGRRADFVAEQLKDAIRRAINALVDAIATIAIPSGLENKFTPLLDAYERLAELLERINGIKIDMEQVRALTLAMQTLGGGFDFGRGPNGFAGATAFGGGGGGSGNGVGSMPIYATINVKLDGQTLEVLFAKAQGSSARNDVIGGQGG